jgi:uncharacterized protein YodC (DUF2158 family)
MKSLRLSESEPDLSELPVHFRIGDIVRLKTGTAPIEVTDATAHWITGIYLKSKTEVYLRNSRDFVMYDKINTTQGKNTMTLYQFTVDSDTKYGTYLATNSQGMFVMEEKGSGVIYTVNKDVVEEVMPYTIDVVFLNSTDTVYGYLAETNKYKVGDVYLLKTPLGHSLVTVVKVDTKSKKAIKDFNPISKITTETL